MKLKKGSQHATIRLELLDAEMESYVNWRAESRSVAESYRRWGCSVGGHRRAAFERYVVALDQEELAAAEYRRAVELVRGT
jgi:hypothetical protein